MIRVGEQSILWFRQFNDDQYFTLQSLQFDDVDYQWLQNYDTSE